MASKQQGKAFHDVALGRSFTVAGGYCPGKQFVPQTKMFAFTRGCGEHGAGGPVLKECVKISHREGWLCEIATGLPKFQRPLARVRIVRDLCGLVATQAGNGVDKKLAALAFEDQDSSDLETPTKEPTQKRQRKKKTLAVAGPEICSVVEVPEQPSPRSNKISVHAALDRHRTLWLHVDALPWLIKYIKEEKATGGLAPVEDEPNASAVADETSRIYWNFRDNNWIARAQSPDGTWLQTSRGIMRKRKAEQLDFQEAKRVAFCELEEWVAKVKAGAE